MAWNAIVSGDRAACVTQLEKHDVPDSIKTAVADLLKTYPGEVPVVSRVLRRPKDPSRPIQTAMASDGSTHEVGNFEDVKISHEGVYRVTISGTPDILGPIQILIEPYYGLAEAVVTPLVTQ